MEQTVKLSCEWSGGLPVNTERWLIREWVCRSLEGIGNVLMVSMN